MQRKVEFLRTGRKREGRVLREPLFHLRAAQFLFLQNSELTMRSRAVINFAWPAGSQQQFLCRELLPEHCLTLLDFSPPHTTTTLE